MTALDLRVYRDGCPTCLLTTNLPVVTSRHGDQIQAIYLCPLCGHIWTCGWNTHATDTPTAEPEVA